MPSNLNIFFTKVTEQTPKLHKRTPAELTWIAFEKHWFCGDRSCFIWKQVFVLNFCVCEWRDPMKAVLFWLGWFGKPCFLPLGGRQVCIQLFDVNFTAFIIFLWTCYPVYSVGGSSFEVVRNFDRSFGSSDIVNVGRKRTGIVSWKRVFWGFLFVIRWFSQSSKKKLPKLLSHSNETKEGCENYFSLLGTFWNSIHLPITFNLTSSVHWKLTECKNGRQKITILSLCKLA